MAKTTYEQVRPMLDGLRAEFRPAFQRRLRQILPLSYNWELTPTTEAIGQALRAFEENARGLIASAVDRVLEVSNRPMAYAHISEALATHLSDLEHDLGEANSRASHLGLTRAVNEDRLSEVRRRLERQLDGYRDAFPGNTETVLDADGKKRGPKRKYDWDAATHAVWGQIYRGDLKPKKQKDIELAFVAVLTKGDEGPEPSTARPYARPIWVEMGFEPED